MYVVFTLRIQ